MRYKGSSGRLTGSTRLPQDDRLAQRRREVEANGYTIQASDENALALLARYATKHDDPQVRTHEPLNDTPQSKIFDPVGREALARMPDFSLHDREL